MAVLFGGVPLRLSAACVECLAGLSLPPSLTATYTTSSTGSYLIIETSGVSAGYDIGNQAYPGWCLQYLVNTIPGVVIPYSTYGTVPSRYAGVPWDKINWLLNNKAPYLVDQWGHTNPVVLQRAIWYLLGYTAEVDPIKDPVSYQALLDAAAHGVGFVPGPGQVVAVLLDSEGQDTIIEVPVPQFGAIGDTVWLDANHNGMQDAGDSGINGVTVWLKDASGKILATAVTGVGQPQGQYLFTDLVKGTYYVEVDVSSPPLAGLLLTPTLVGSDRAIDSNVSPSMVVLPDNHSEDRTIDFGYQTQCTGQIGDFVWNDYNHDGIQDAGEPGIPNVTVRLLDLGGALRQTAYTNASGLYVFSGVCAGTYNVAVDSGTLPAGYTPTLSGQGGDQAKDSNGSPAAVTLPYDNSTDLTVDFGYLQPCGGLIGDFVWHDLNHNGVQDAGEPGIDGITVLLKLGGALVGSTTTAGGGYYQFPGVCAGSYTVELTNVPAGYTPTITGAGTPDTDSSNSSAGVTLPTPTSVDRSVDFGFIGACTGKIGDLVWNDLNHNGIQDAGEPGWPGVTVYLRRASDNTILQTATTDSNGAYLFSNVCMDAYRVEAVPPAGYMASPAGQTTADKDSNPNPAPVALPNDAASDLTIDFGFYGGSIGDTVWHDFNADQIQNAAEPGLSGWTVTITGPTLPSGYISTQTTDASGLYLFTNLPAGQYTVCVTPQPGGWIQTYDLDGVGTANCAVRILAAGENARDVDFGYRLPVTSTCVGINAIQGVPITPVTLTGAGGSGGPYTFTATGLPDGLSISSTGTISGTPTVSGSFNYTVTVTDKDGHSGTINCSVTVAPKVSATCVGITAIQGVPITPVTLTGAGGTGGPYTFTATGLPDGLSISATGTISGTPNVSGSFNYTVTVKDKDGHTGTINCSVTVAPAPTNVCALTWGYWKNHVSLWPVDSLTLGSQIYNSTELQTLLRTSVAGDASMNLAHQLIAAKFNVLNGTNIATANGAITTADNLLTAAQGGTSNKLPYRIASSSTLGAQMVAAANALDTFNSDGKAQPGCVMGGGGCSGSIGNFVWWDANANGIQDLGELGLGGVTLKLYDDHNTLLRTTTTDANGHYQFTGLCPGAYVVVAVAPTGYAPTLAGQGTAADKDSNQSPTMVVLTTGNSSNQDIDYGFVKTSCSGIIGNFVWKDANGNGIQDTGELGIQGVLVSLYSSTGILLEKSITDATGAYQFSGLCAATYFASATAPPGYTATSSLIGTDRSKDSNANPSAVTLATSTSSDLTIDFGFKVVGSTATGFTTYTPGGWGAPPNGKNAGSLLQANFSRVYTTGSNSIGGTLKLTFTSALAIQGFLPQGGTPGPLTGMSLSDPTTSPAGVFAGQVLALDLAVDFSTASVTKAGLANLRCATGKLAGQTVAQVLTLANKVLGGDLTALPSGMTVSDLNSVLDSINQNFDGGTVNKGYLM